MQPNREGKDTLVDRAGEPSPAFQLPQHAVKATVESDTCQVTHDTRPVVPLRNNVTVGNHSAKKQTPGGVCPLREEIHNPHPAYFSPYELLPAASAEVQTGTGSMSRVFIRRNPENAMRRLQAADRRRDFEAEMKQVFDAFDADGNGTVSCSELMTMLHRLGASITDKEIKSVMDASDLDHNGKLDFKEFCYMCLYQGWI